MMATRHGSSAGRWLALKPGRDKRRVIIDKGPGQQQGQVLDRPMLLNPAARRLSVAGPTDRCKLFRDTAYRSRARSLRTSYLETGPLPDDTPRALRQPTRPPTGLRGRRVVGNRRRSRGQSRGRRHRTQQSGQAATDDKRPFPGYAVGREIRRTTGYQPRQLQRPWHDVHGHANSCGILGRFRCCW